MFRKRPVWSCSAARVVVCAALLGAGDAAANMFSTSDSLRDFVFNNLGDVVYSNPALDQVSLELSANNEVLITSVNNADLSTDPNGGDVVGKLKLTRDEDEDGDRAEYYLFGSLPDPDKESTGYLVTGTMDAMQSGSENQGLSYLFSGRVTAIEGVKYQQFGLFAEPFAIDEVLWATQYDPSASALNLYLKVTSANDLSDTAGSEMPVPATPFLLLAGLIGLRLARRRGRSD